MDRNAFIRELLNRGAGRGVASEVCFESGSSFEAQVRDGELLQYNVSDSAGLGFRVLKDGRTGTASTQILDDEALDQLVDGALENAALVESKDEQFMYPGDENYPGLDLYNPEIDALPAARKIEMARALESVARTNDREIIWRTMHGVLTN